MIKLIKKLLGMECYVSEIDYFIAEVDKRYPQKSASQQQDIANAERVAYLRDHVVANQDNNKIWKNF